MHKNEYLRDVKELRVRYSTIINYLLILYRVFTSMVFTIIVIRKLPVENYGLFSYIIAFISFFTPVTILWNFWAYRFHARGRYDVSNTSFTLTLLYSVLGFVIIYLLLSKTLTDSLIIVASGLIFVGQGIYSYLSNILFSKRPYMVGYINIIIETIRAALAYILIMTLKLGLAGALIDIMSVYIIGDALTYIALLYIGSIVKPYFNTKSIILLFKNSYIPLVRIINNQIITSAERLYTTNLTGSTIFSAYLGVSYTSRSFIQGKDVFARSLSARLLRGISSTDIEDVFRILIMLSVLSTSVFVIYSKTILSIFRKEYLDAYILLILFSIGSFLNTIASYLSTISTASEKMDLYSSGLALRKSTLFRNPFTTLLANIGYFSIGAIFFAVTYIFFNIRDYVLLLYPFPVAYIVSRIPLIIIFYKRSLEITRYKIPWKEIYASTVGSILIAIYAYFSGTMNFIVKSIYTDYIELLVIMANIVVIYFMALYILSPWVRRTVNAIIKSVLIQH